MLKINEILGINKINEKVVKIPSWGGEVKIRPLSIKERGEVISVLQGDVDINDEWKPSNISLSAITKAQILTAHYALIEPKISVSELEDMPESAFAGIKEICDEVEKLNAKK